MKAYREGFKAGFEHLDHTANPYGRESMDRDEWYRGWVEGMVEYLNEMSEPGARELVHIIDTIMAAVLMVVAIMSLVFMIN